MENLNHGFTKYVFAVLVVLLFVGAELLGREEAYNVC